MFDKKEYARQYHIRNRKKILQRVKDYYRKNTQKVKDYAKKYAKENAEEIKIKQHNRYLNNRKNIIFRSAEFAKNNRDKVRSYKRKYYKNNREKVQEYNNRRRKTSAGIARDKLCHAVSNGKIIRPSICSKCGQGGRIHGHHPDYSKPFDVIWLCALCHGKMHLKTSC